MKMRIAVVAAPMVMMLLMLAGCGGDDKSDSGSANASRNFATSNEQCDAKGINDKDAQTGTCARDGVTYTVVDKDQPLNIDELDAKVTKVNVTKTLKGDQKLKARQGHSWVEITMQVKNKTDKPQRVGGPGFEQMMIGNGRSVFPEAPSTIAKDMFFQLGAIPPGATRTGRAVFEVTNNFARNFKREKVDLAIANFSDSGYVQNSKRLGVIRLWRESGREL
jgi:hypothetical protein